MRIYTLLPAFFALQLAAQEMRIWGLTPSGGAHGKGTVFVVDADGSDFTTLIDLDDATGWGPEGGLCLAPNGFLYGFTTFGGTASPAGGTLFTIDPADGSFTKLHDFDLSDGGFTWGRPIVCSDDQLYFTGYGGSDGGGGIFRLDPANNTFDELYALDQSADGGAITGRLLQGSDGFLYGAASQGGAHSESGTLFRFDLANNTFNKLYDFDGGAGGRTPYGGLCEAGNGWLYGTTFEGGLNNKGIVYKYDASSGVFAKIHDFGNSNGSSCWNSLLRLGPDLLIGGVANGGLNSGGYLFTVVPSTDQVTVVTNFNLATGSNPVGDLVSAPDGTIYALLSQGGAEFFGTLCRIDPITYQPTVLSTFDLDNDGGLPRGEVAFTGGEVGVREHSYAPFFSLAPNPTEGAIMLRCEQEQLPATAHITDALGRSVGTVNLTNTSMAIELGAVPGIRCITVTGATRTWTQRAVVH